VGSSLQVFRSKLYTHFLSPTIALEVPSVLYSCMNNLNNIWWSIRFANLIKVWITVFKTSYCFYVQMTVPDPRTFQSAKSEWPHGHECLRAHNARWPRRMAFSPSPLARRALRIAAHSNMYSRSIIMHSPVNECWHTRSDNDLLLLSPAATSSASSPTSNYLADELVVLLLIK
jgi:hypothetical protein